VTTRIAVLGAGSWGTAFAVVLADAGCRVSLWARRPALADAIRATGTNAEYFPDVDLPPGITATADAAAAVAGAEFVMLAVPSQSLRANLTDWAALIDPGTVLVSLMKGVELGTAKLMSEVIAEVTGATAERIAVVSGPNLAGEIVRRQPAAAVVACRDEAVARRLQTACHTPYYRPYTNTDVVGCEIGGAVKHLGRGLTVAQAAEATTRTAEGVTSCRSVLDLARRHDVDMPIVATVVDIVHGGMSPRAAVEELMTRSAKAERS
jgi:glycerol-3-phosphate dehydrogenase (NAD(P)+)